MDRIDEWTTAASRASDGEAVAAYAVRELADFIRLATEEVVTVRDSTVLIGVAEGGDSRMRIELGVDDTLEFTEASMDSDGSRAALAGGSPAALLHAVYSYLEELGFCFDASGESAPARKRVLELPRMEWRHTPSVRERGIRMHLNFVQDQSFFTEEEFAAFIDRSARLKFNTLLYHMYTPQMWFPFQYAGVRHLDLSLGNLERKPIDPGMIGREKVKVKDHWFPREFEDIREAEPMLQAVYGRLRRMMRRARERGMANAVSMEPESVPPGILDAIVSREGGREDGRAADSGIGVPALAEEWQSGWSGRRLGELDMRDPLLLDITVERCLQAIDAFPDLDELQLISREGTAWRPGEGESYEGEMRRLIEKFDLDDGVFDREALARTVRMEDGPEMNPKAHPYWTVLPGSDFYPTVIGSLRFVELALSALEHPRLSAKLAERDIKASIAVYSPNPETVRLMMPAIAAMLPTGFRFHCLADYSAKDIAASLPDWRPLAERGHGIGVFSWLEFDGIMMLAQGWTEALADNVRAALALGARTILFNHWRIRSLEHNFAAAAAYCWNAEESGDRFLARYAGSRYGAELAAVGAGAYRKLEEASYYAKRFNYNIGFTADWVIVHSTGQPGYSWRVLAESAKRFGLAAESFRHLAEASFGDGRVRAGYMADLCEMSALHVRAVAHLQNAKLPLIGYNAWPLGNPHAAWPAPSQLGALLAEVETALALEERYMQIYAPWVKTCDEQGQLVMHHQGVIEPLRSFVSALRGRLDEERAAEARLKGDAG